MTPIKTAVYIGNPPKFSNHLINSFNFVILYHKFCLKLMINKFLFPILRILLGGVFIFSAISKLFPIEIFELNFVESGLISWELAPWLARVLVALEFVVGLCLIFNIKLKKITIPFSLFLLIFFSIFLIYSLIKDGNDGNCGCFGTLLPMTPLESLIKNIVLIGLFILLQKKHSNTQSIKILDYKLLPYLLLVPAFATMFIAFPISINSLPLTNPPTINETANFTDYTDFTGAENTSLKEGEKIVAFLSLGCDHCKEVAMKLAIINKEEKLPPIYFYFFGTEKNVPVFINDTKAKFPYKLLDIKSFLAISGSSIPRVVVIKNDIIKADWRYKDFNASTLKHFFSKKGD